MCQSSRTFFTFIDHANCLVCVKQTHRSTCQCWPQPQYLQVHHKDWVVISTNVCLISVDQYWVVFFFLIFSYFLVISFILDALQGCFVGDPGSRAIGQHCKQLETVAVLWRGEWWWYAGNRPRVWKVTEITWHCSLCTSYRCGFAGVSVVSFSHFPFVRHSSSLKLLSFG